MSEISDAERWAAAAAWSRRTTLTAIETVLWRAEEHPVQSSTSVHVIDLDGVPEWKRFVAAHEWGTQMVARLRQRVVEPVWPTTAPIWAVDTHFRLDHHVRRSEAGSSADAVELATEFALRSLDRERPLWESLLIDGLDEGHAWWVLKTHHALADPWGVVQLLSLLQSRTRAHVPDKPVLPDPPTVHVPDPVELAGQGLVRLVADIPSVSAALTRRGVFAAAHPRTSLGAGLKYAASLRRLVGRPPTEPSPLLADRDGQTWRFVSLARPLAGLRAVGDAARGSLQDVTIAVVLGALRRYHEAHDGCPDELPLGVRVSLDRADDPGNRHASAMIAAPVGIVDLEDRVAAVRGEILALHTERALDAFSVFAPVANRLPVSVGAALMVAGTAADAFVTTLPGPTRVGYMAGSRVEGIYSFGPLPGTALTATLVSYGDMACFGVTLDASAVDAGLFHTCLAEELDEIESARSTRSRAPLVPGGNDVEAAVDPAAGGQIRDDDIDA